MTVSETLSAAWNMLKEDLQPNPGLYERRVFADSRHSLFVAVTQPGGLGQLMFIVPKHVIRIRFEMETRGFRVRVEPYAKSSQVRIRLEEVRQGYGDLFRRLCEDVVTAVLPCTTDDLAVETMQTRLAHWQRFLEKASTGLSDAEQLGLYGELCFLKKLLAAGYSGARTIEGWQGPLGTNHDFMFGPTAVEIKSTTSNLDSVVTISNERQLDDTGTETLFLCHISFDRRERASDTLPALIDELEQLIDSALVPAFEDRLLTAGYHRSQADLYRDTGYAERKATYYRVSAVFPRIVPRDLKTGVVNVQYCVELAAAAGCVVSESEVFGKII